jgi:hypothetical protein
VYALQSIERRFRPAARGVTHRLRAPTSDERAANKSDPKVNFEQGPKRRGRLLAAWPYRGANSDESRAREQLADDDPKPNPSAFNRPVRKTVIVAAKPNGLSAATRAYGIN